MKKLFVAIAMVLIGSTALAAREDGPASKLSARSNEKASQCGKAAGNRKGSERKAFIEGCLSSPSVSTARKKACEEKAKASGKSGKELENFKRKCRLGRLVQKPDRSSDH